MSSDLSCPNIYTIKPCATEASYLREGAGNTFMPWLFALLLTLFHLAVLFGRIRRWEKSQYLSIATASFALFLTGIAYVSTNLSAETVYVWFPITLSGDIGAVLQLHAIIYNEHRKTIADLKYIEPMWTFLTKTRGSHSLQYSRGRNTASLFESYSELEPKVNPGTLPQLNLVEVQSDLPVSSDQPNSRSRTPLSDATISPEPRDNNDIFSTPPTEGIAGHRLLDDSCPTINPKTAPVRKALPKTWSGKLEIEDELFVFDAVRVCDVDDHIELEEVQQESQLSKWQLGVLLILAWLLLIGLLVMQCIGLAFASIRLRENDSNPPMKTWCSPAFQSVSDNSSNIPSGSLFDGTCENNYTVFLNSQGTGCIRLPGDQPLWLGLTVWVITIQLISQSVDVWLLIKYRNSKGWLKLRPLCTMISGVLVWSTLTIVSGIETTQYPLVSHVTAIVSPTGQMCRVLLEPAGLRGEVIAFFDGLLAAFNKWYFGPLGKE